MPGSSPFRTIGLLTLFLLTTGNSFVVVAAQDQQQLAKAERLNGQVVQLFSTGSYSQAIPIAEQVLEIWEAELGPQHADVALGLANLGELHRQLGNNADARPLHERALRIRERLHGRKHADTALSLTYVAMVHENLGNSAIAEKHYRQALQVRKTVFGPEHPEVANSLNNLANLLKGQAQYSEAESLLLRSMEIRRKTQGGEHIDITPSLNNLATMYHAQGRYNEAERLHQQALEIRLQHLGEQHQDTAYSLNNLAAVYEAQGRYDEAKPLYQRALKVRLAILGEQNQLTASTINNLGGLHERQGNFTAAEQHYKRALNAFKSSVGPKHYDTGAALNNLASLYKEQQRYADAQPLYEQALAVFAAQLGNEHPSTAKVVNNLGLLYERLGNFAAAEEHYRRALAIRRKTLGDEHPDTAVSVNDLALLTAARGNVEQAISLLEESLAIRRRTLGDSHPNTVDGLNNLAAYQEKAGDRRSVETLDQARRGVRQHVVRVLPALPEAEQAMFLRVAYERDFDLALSCALQHADDSTTVSTSAGWLLNGKAVGREALAQRNLARREGGTPQTPPNWVEIDQLREKLPANTVMVDIARFEVFDFEIRPGAATWLPARYAAWIIPPVGQGEIRLIDLGAAETIDTLIQQTRRGLINAHGANGTIAASSEPSAVAETTKLLQSVADRVWRPLQQHLADFDSLILSPDGDLWLLPWAALPINNSNDEEPRLLVENYALRMVVSGRDVAISTTATSPLPPVILANPQFDQQVSDKENSIKAIFRELPKADEDTLRSFSAKTLIPDVEPLPNTELEAIYIKQQIETFAGQEAKVYKQRYALESVAKALKGPRVAVFATHGFFLPKQDVPARDSLQTNAQETRSAFLDASGNVIENPLLRCGLLLSGCNQREAIVGADDGILTGTEVTGIDLRGTELVVLSACETGLGDINRGEGVAGLRQAFQLAGAQAVVASLWQISDRETTLLINDFFRNLASGQPKATALRNAQLSRIQKRRERYGAAHPFYWAAFTLTGR